MKKVLVGFSTAVIVIFLLSVYGWAVKHITIGDKEMGFVSEPIKALINFPDLFEESVEEVKTITIPKTFVKTPENFQPTNKLTKEVRALTTYTNENNNRTIDLVNLATGESLYKWEVKNPFADHARLMNPIMLANKSIVYAFSDMDGLVCIDSLGNKIWEQKTIAAHHGMNLDKDGNLWTCSYDRQPPNGFILYKAYYKLDGRRFNFVENTISLINPQTGEILYHKSLSEILKENDLGYLLIHSGDTNDPMHLNDVQPALKTTEFYNEGDVFLSLRNLSCILHFRPTTGKVLRVIRGPFFTQHDVDFYDDNTLVFFNNNSHALWQNPPAQWPLASETFEVGDYHSGITFYDLSTGEFSNPYDSIFSANQIFSHTEGLIEFLPDGSVFIEEQNHSYIWIIKDGEVLYHNVQPSHIEGYHHLTNWIRIIENK